jgi:hypothetical protein
LPHADRFDDHDLVAHRVHHSHGIERRVRESPEIAAGTHGSDEDAWIGSMALHPYPVAEDCAPRIGAGWIDRDYADARTAAAQVLYRGIDQG